MRLRNFLFSKVSYRSKHESSDNFPERVEKSAAATLENQSDFTTEVWMKSCEQLKKDLELACKKFPAIKLGYSEPVELYGDRNRISSKETSDGSSLEGQTATSEIETISPELLEVDPSNIREEKSDGSSLEGQTATSEIETMSPELLKVDPSNIREEKSDGSSLKKKQEKLVKAKTKKVRVVNEKTSNSWKELLANPKDWLDHRGNKANGLVKPRHPDFKRKKDGLPLWLNRAPDWVLPSLEGLEFDVRVPRGKSEQLEDALWKDLAQNPDNWFDNRLIKKNKKAPCFKHKETGVGLWMNKSHTWVLSKLPPPKKEQGLKGEEFCNNFVQNLDQWCDNRSDKTNPKVPDFMNKKTGEGVWVNQLPTWVLSKLPPVKKKGE